MGCGFEGKVFTMQQYVYLPVLSEYGYPIVNDGGYYDYAWTLEKKDGQDVLLDMIAGDVQIVTANGLGFGKTIYTEVSSVFSSGVSLVKSRFDKRQIKLVVQVPCDKRHTYFKYFRNDAKLRLTVDLGGGLRYMDCIVNNPDESSYTSCSSPFVTLNLQGNYPFWLDVETFGKDIGERIGLLGTAPYEGLPTPAGVFVYDEFNPAIIRPVVSDYYLFGNSYDVDNKGDVPVGFYFKINVTGDVKNPFVKVMTTGEFIRVFVSMVEGDVLEISTVFQQGVIADMDRHVYVKLNGVNYNMKVDLLSTPNATLPPGKNTISFGSEIGAGNMQLYFFRQWGHISA